MRITQRQGNLFLALIIIFILIQGLIIAIRVYQEDMKNYDRDNCAVYGYEADCQTKLKGGE